MKSPSEELFILIKSLNSAEKLHFKMYSKRNKQSNYLKLFDAIDKQKKYDEELLKLKLKGNSFIENIKFVKSYLSESILGFLTNFHSKMDIEIELQELIHRIKILINKGMLAMATKRLLKANKLAIENDCYEYLLITGQLEINILLLGRDPDKTKRYLLKHKEQQKYIACIENIREYKNLNYQLVAITLAGDTEKMSKRISKIMRHPLLVSPNRALSYLSLEQYYLIHFLHSFILSNWDRIAYRRQKEWLQYLEKHKQNLTNRGESYLVALSNFIATQLYTGHIKETEISFQKALNYMKLVPAKRQSAQMQSSFLTITNNYISAQIYMNNYEKAITTWEGIVKRKVAVGSKQNLIILLNMFNAHFHLRQYHEALFYLNKVIHAKTNSRQSILQYARLFILLTHYELANYELLPYLTRATKRYLDKNSNISVCDKIILKYFERKLPKIGNKKREKVLFEQFKKELTEADKSLTMLIPVEHFDFVSWLESKIESRSFAEIVKAKAGNAK